MKSWYSSKRKQIAKINLLQDLYNMWSWPIQWKTNGESEQEGREKAMGYTLKDCQNSLVAQTVKRPPAMQETRVRSLGQEDPLEKKMAIHSSTLAWRIPWMKEPGGLQSVGSQRSGHDWVTSHITHRRTLSGKLRFNKRSNKRPMGLKWNERGRVW